MARIVVVQPVNLLKAAASRECRRPNENQIVRNLHIFQTGAIHKITIADRRKNRQTYRFREVTTSRETARRQLFDYVAALREINADQMRHVFEQANAELLYVRTDRYGCYFIHSRLQHSLLFRA